MQRGRSDIEDRIRKNARAIQTFRIKIQSRRRDRDLRLRESFALKGDVQRRARRVIAVNVQCCSVRTGIKRSKLQPHYDAAVRSDQCIADGCNTKEGRIAGNLQMIDGKYAIADIVNRVSCVARMFDCGGFENNFACAVDCRAVGRREHGNRGANERLTVVLR